jgi:hypothetical protein
VVGVDEGDGLGWGCEVIGEGELKAVVGVDVEVAELFEGGVDGVLVYILGECKTKRHAGKWVNFTVKDLNGHNNDEPFAHPECKTQHDEHVCWDDEGR